MPSTLADVTWPLYTERLSVRPAVDKDVETTWRYRRLESVARYLPALPVNIADHRRVFAGASRLARTLIVELRAGADEQEGTALPGAVQSGDTAAGQRPVVIGDLKIDVANLWAQDEVLECGVARQAELGWAFDPSFHGHGYGTEAVTEALRICFDELHLRRAVAYCFAANEASWRLMERVGMRREAYHVRDGYHRSGQWLDGMFYAMLADEWRALRSGRH